jgi:hypothetical protein
MASPHYDVRTTFYENVQSVWCSTVT